MKTFVIKKEHLDKDNFYIGYEDLSDFNGNIESDENLGYVRFKRCVSVKGFINFKAGSGIKAGLGIEAGLGIKAGSGIEAGSGIKAGSGIEAGLGITCKTTLSIGLRIFAGLCLWRNLTEDELKITCGKLEKGIVCFGNLIETGIEEKPTELTIQQIEEMTGLKNIKIVKQS